MTGKATTPETAKASPLEGWRWAYGHKRVSHVSPPRTSANLRVRNVWEDVNVKLVEWVQGRLNANGHELEVNGQWDGDTVDAASRFAAANNMPHEDRGFLTYALVTTLDDTR